MKKIHKKISAKVHTMVKLLATLEQTSVADIVDKAIEKYKTDFPGADANRAPIQNPLIYPTESKSVVLPLEASEYIDTLPVGNKYTGVKSPLDRVLIHYQNASGLPVPHGCRINWLDEENLKWVDTIPED